MINIRTIGKLAREVLSQPGHLSIQGQTSKGIFIRHSIGQIVFISREPFSGPYTLTLNPEEDLPELVEPLFLLNYQGIQDGNSVFINPAAADEYRAEPFLWNHKLQPDFNAVCKLADLACATHPLGGLCSQLQGIPLDYLVEDERWQTVWQAVFYGPVDAWPTAFAPICGYGRGLTPSGDDFLLGMLLGLRRYSHVLPISTDIEQALEAILKSAQGKTTTISQNLLYAADLGMADDRLITAFDAWLMGSFGAYELHELLRTWGNSSGLDAFSGFAGLVYRVIGKQ